MSSPLEVAQLTTGFGAIAVVAHAEGILQVLTAPSPALVQRQLESAFPGAVSMASGEARRGVRQLEEYFSGQRQRFTLRLDLAGLTPFTRRVLEELGTIPYGTTLSYQELAARCGSPCSARAVGQVMRRNRWPLLLPCHRVVARGGGCGGYSAAGGEAGKRWLLAFEAAVAAGVRGEKNSQKDLDSPSSPLL